MELWKLEYFRDTIDIKIKVENIVYDLNSNIIYISDYIRMMCTGGMMESKQNIKEIVEIDKETWELFLNVIYSDYIKEYLNKYRNNIKTIEIEDIISDGLTKLMIFADKILVRYIVNRISDHFVDKYLISIKDEYKTYNEMLKYINVEKLDKITKNIVLENIPKYYVLEDKWTLDYEKISKYPYVFYYILVNLSQIITEKNNYQYNLDLNFYPVLGIEKLNNSLSINNWNIFLDKLPSIYHHEYGFQQYNQNSIRLILKKINIFLQKIFHKLVAKYIECLSIIYIEDWRIPGDDLIYDLIKNTYTFDNDE